METCKCMFSFVHEGTAAFSRAARFPCQQSAAGSELEAARGHDLTMYTAQVDTYDQVRCGIEAASRRRSSALLCVYSTAATTTQEQLTTVQH